MKKFISIIVLSLLCSGSLNAKEVKFMCNKLYANGKPDLNSYFEYHIKNNKVYDEDGEYMTYTFKDGETSKNEKPGYRNIIFNKDNIYFETFWYMFIGQGADKPKKVNFNLWKNILNLETKILTQHFTGQEVGESIYYSSTTLNKCQIIKLKL